MHNIQYSILTLLLTHEIRRFSELKPKHVESNLFQYHLKHLIKERYVEKVTGGYTLSTYGLYYADRHSSSLKTERPQPKIISVIVISNDVGQVLVLPKLKQPFINTYHLPAGKIHEGESATEAAARELTEKTGLVDVDLHYQATVHSSIRYGDSTISEYYGTVFTGVYNGNVTGCLWQDPAGVAVALTPSVEELLAVAGDATTALHEWTIDATPWLTGDRLQ